MRSVIVSSALKPQSAAENGRYRSLPFGQVETSRSEHQVFTTGVTYSEGQTETFGAILLPTGHAVVDDDSFKVEI